MSRSHLTPAEATDRHGRLLALSMSTMAVLFGANAAKRIAGDELEQFVDVAQIVLVMAIGLLLIPVFRWKAVVLRSFSPEERRHYFAADSYMVSSLKKARALSWSVTFVLLVLLSIASGVFSDMPARFFLDAALAVMVGVFAITVLVLNR